MTQHAIKPRDHTTRAQSDESQVTDLKEARDLKSTQNNEKLISFSTITEAR